MTTLKHLLIEAQGNICLAKTLQDPPRPPKSQMETIFTCGIMEKICPGNLSHDVSCAHEVEEKMLEKDSKD